MYIKFFFKKIMKELIKFKITEKRIRIKSIKLNTQIN